MAMKDSMKVSVMYRIVEFCARECHLQNSGELSVARMVEAYLYAMDFRPAKGLFSFVKNFTAIDWIRQLGVTVEPDKNDYGFRMIPVLVPGPIQPPKAELVCDLVKRLVENQGSLTPFEFYTEFEKIHPFVDGNGRVGVILYNFLKDSMEEPELPPDPFARESNHDEEKEAEESKA